MTERSMFWADGIGDGGPYSEDELRLLYDALAGSEDADRGVLVTQGNELVPSSTGNNNIRMAVGRAVVDGTVYENDAILDIVTASPAIGTTGRRLVLQKDWAARTVRAVVITSADGVGGLPALTQNDGTIWEIPIASFTITTGGVIGALTDEREFCEGTDSRGITILDRDQSQVDDVSDNTERTIYSHTIPAGAMGVDGGFRLTLGGNMLVGVAALIRFRIKLGPTTVFQTLPIAPAQNVNRYRWQWTILCMNITATTQKWVTIFEARTSTNTFALGLGNDGLTFEGYGHTPSGAEDTTGPLLFEVTVDWDVISADASFRKEMAVLELLPAA